MNTEIEIEEIKNRLRELGMKLDALIQDRETLAMMLISERTLKEFLSGEPDPYSPRDVKVAYR